STLGVGSGFYRAVIFDNRQEQLLPGLEILGIRLRDFRKKQPYAAFLTTDGQMGLIGKDGRQATDANGTPLRFEYIGQKKEDKIRVCVRGKKTPANVGKEKQPVVISGGTLSKMFNLQYKPGDERKKIVFSNIKIVSNQNLSPLWGYLDSEGKTVIEPEFEFAADFKDSFAINRKNGKWGVVDHRGQPRIPFAYHAVKAYGKNWRTYLRNPDTLYFDLEGRYFPDAHSAKISGLPEGLFVRKDKATGKYGYVDMDGAAAIPYRFDVAQDFSEGLAAVREAGKWVFIDTLGQIVAAPDSLLGPIAEIGSFSEGLCWFRTGKGKTIGYLDRTGRAQIEPAFHGKPADFQRGVAKVRVKRDPALIDKNGRFVVWPGRYGLIGDFSRTGLAEVRDTAFYLRGLINLEGTEVIPVEYTQIISSELGHAVFDGAYWQYLGSDGTPLLPLRSKEPLKKLTSNLAMVRDTANGLWSYVFLPGGEVFLKDFRQAEPFQNGYAEVSRAVYSKDSLMIVSEYGSFLEPKPGERFLKLTEGLIQVEKMTTARPKAPKFYYAGTTGQNYFHREFFTNEPFRNGVAIVKPNTRFGAFNRRGWFVLPPKYATIKHQGNYLQTTPLLQGFVSHDGKNIVEPAFDLLELLDNGLLRVEWGDKIGYLRQNGTWVWPPGGLVR
ncbi:MAG TPA: WG repeat-containing protein, partial [Saprospiraceae bacterium]|nr:WG repeat-containing protein [Saprospiraceae bacterium]